MMRDVSRHRHRPAPCGPRGFPLVNASDAAAYLRRDHNIRVAPATVRDWARRKQITTHSLGRERYDLREVVTYAMQRVEVDSDSPSCHTSVQAGDVSPHLPGDVPGTPDRPAA